jgi:hypothetical protein
MTPTKTDYNGENAVFSLSRVCIEIWNEYVWHWFIKFWFILFSVWELMLVLLIVLSKIVLVKQEQVVVLKWSMILNLTGEYDVISSIIKRNVSFAFSWFLFNHFLSFDFIGLFFVLLFFVYFPTSPICW